MLKDKIAIVMDTMNIFQGGPMMPSTRTFRHAGATNADIKSALERRFG